MVTQGGFYIGDFNGYGIIVSENNYEVRDQWSKTYFTTKTSENDGYLNTVMMNSRNDSPIAKYVLSLNINGYSDWYIPSRNEFIFMSKNRHKLPNEYEFLNSWYWTSTQHSSNTDYVWMRNFNYGNEGIFNIYNGFYVRAIRRFPLN